MFGYRKPTPVDLIPMWPSSGDNVNDYMNTIVPAAEEARQRARQRADKKALQNRTYKNQNRTVKTFVIGSIVLVRQNQVATGKQTSLKPTFYGPFVIVKLESDGVTALVEHLHTREISKAHFSNMHLLDIDPSKVRLHNNFDIDLFAQLTELTGLNLVPGPKARLTLAEPMFPTREERQRPPPIITQPIPNAENNAEMLYEQERDPNNPDPDIVPEGDTEHFPEYGTQLHSQSQDNMNNGRSRPR